MLKNRVYELHRYYNLQVLCYYGTTRENKTSEIIFFFQITTLIAYTSREQTLMVSFQITLIVFGMLH